LQKGGIPDSRNLIDQSLRKGYSSKLRSLPFPQNAASLPPEVL